MQIYLIIHSRVLPMDRYCFAWHHYVGLWVSVCLSQNRDDWDIESPCSESAWIT